MRTHEIALRVVTAAWAVLAVFIATAFLTGCTVLDTSFEASGAGFEAKAQVGCLSTGLGCELPFASEEEGEEE